jgi:hypothetical protein
MDIRERQQPPSDNHLPHLPLIRVPTRTAMRLAITSVSMYQVDTHYMGRRTLPCTTTDCPGCAAQLPRRYEAYIAALTTTPTRHVIVALTPRAAKQLWDSAPDPHNMRGIIITLQRMGNRANGPLMCRVEQEEHAESKLPPMPELRAHMARIWGLDRSHEGTDHPYYRKAVQQEQFNADEQHGS